MFGAEALVGHLTLRSGRADTPALRLALARHLGSEELNPRGIPPREILIIRRLDEHLPAETLRAGWKRGAAAAGRLAAGVEASRAAAVRPRRGRLPPDAAAVLFGDEAELLACLALDVAAGAQGRRWWWTAVLARLDPQARVRLAALLASDPRVLPAAVALLEQWGLAEVVLRGLTETETEVLSALVAETFGLEPLPSRVGTEAPQSLPYRKGRAESAVSGARGGAAPPSWPLGIRDGVKGIDNEPSSTGATPGAVALRQEAVRLVDLCRQVVRGRAAVDRLDRPAGLPEALAPSHLGISADAPLPLPGRNPVRVHRGRTPPRADAASTLGIDVAEPISASAGARQPAYAVDDSGQIPANAESPFGAGVAPGSIAGTIADEQNTRIPVTQRVGTGARAASERTGPPATAPRMAPGSIPSRTRESPADWSVGVPTVLGGVLYLIHLLRALGLPHGHPNDLRSPRDLGFWGMLELVGRALASEAAFQSDPLWTLLAELDGRTVGSLPSGTLPAGIGFRLPVAWRDDLRDATRPIRWWSARGRLTSWCGRLLVLDVPDPGSDGARRTALSAWGAAVPAGEGRAPDLPLLPSLLDGLDPGLGLWLRRLVPALTLRLDRALGLTEESGEGLRRHLLGCSGTLYLTPTHLDLVAGLDQISLAVRRAGLDRDPGWLPELGKVVTFHYR